MIQKESSLIVKKPNLVLLQPWWKYVIGLERMKKQDELERKDVIRC